MGLGDIMTYEQANKKQVREERFLEKGKRAVDSEIDYLSSDGQKHIIERYKDAKDKDMIYSMRITDCQMKGRDLINKRADIENREFSERALAGLVSIGMVAGFATGFALDEVDAVFDSAEEFVSIAAGAATLGGGYLAYAKGLIEKPINSLRQYLNAKKLEHTEAKRDINSYRLEKLGRLRAAKFVSDATASAKDAELCMEKE